MAPLSRRALFTGALAAAAFGDGAVAPGAAPAMERLDADAVRFEIDPGGHIFVQATLMGRAVAALVDSGAAATVLDRTFATALGLPAASAEEAAGLTDRLVVTGVRLPAISVGGHRMPATSGHVLDLSSVSASLGRQVDLVLGQDLLAGSSVMLDFESRTMSFEPAGAALKRGYARLDLRASPHGRLYLPVSIEDGPPVEAMYDLGSNVPVYVSGDYARARGLLAARKVSKSATVGAEGLAISQIATLRTLSIGGFTLRDVPVQAPERWNQTAPVLIGAPVWRRFSNIIDLDHRRLDLKPEPQAFARPFQKDRSGIGADRLADRLRIVFVAPGSPAAAAGLQAGDEILRIDGVRVDEAFYAARPRPGAEAAGTTERLTLASGRVAEIRLADYF